jgi:large subunit ribosomal protein L3
MLKGIIGRKLGMTQVFGDTGNIIPITVIEAGPCSVVQVKTKEKEGYNAYQLGFLKKKPQRVNRPLTGHFQKSGAGPFYCLKELTVEEVGEYAVGQEVTLEAFKAGDMVDITGTSKGRGFAGVIKRHGFRGFPGSHGTHEYFRHGGSIGSHSYPGKTFKGMKMAGHYGNSRRHQLHRDHQGGRQAAVGETADAGRARRLRANGELRHLQSGKEKNGNH